MREKERGGGRERTETPEGAGHRLHQYCKTEPDQASSECSDGGSQGPSDTRQEVVPTNVPLTKLFLIGCQGRREKKVSKTKKQMGKTRGGEGGGGGVGIRGGGGGERREESGGERLPAALTGPFSISFSLLPV